MSAALDRRESFEQNGPLPVRRECTDMITVTRDQISVRFKFSNPTFTPTKVVLITSTRSVLSTIRVLNPLKRNYIISTNRH